MIDLTGYKAFLQARGWSNNYHNCMRIFLVYLGNRVLSQEIITEFFNENNYSDKTKCSFISAGRNYQIYLGNETSEWNKIKLIKCPYKIPNYLSEKELGQAISYLGNFHRKLIEPVKAEALLNFLFYSGVRKAELIGLKRVDIDLVECIAKVYGKGKKERMVYFPKRVSDNINTYFQSEKEQTNAFNMSAYDLDYLIKTVLKKCFPTKNITIHLFRHSGARTMRRKGVDPIDISRILGHSSVQTTLRYLDSNEEEIRNNYKEKMK
jgi:site-specific recombinase XerD